MERFINIYPAIHTYRVADYIILFFHCFTIIYIYRDGAELMVSSNPVHACHDQSKNISIQIVKIFLISSVRRL